MKSTFFISILAVVLAISCSSSHVKATPQQIEALDILVASNSFVITSEYAYPLVTNSISSLQNSGVLAPGENPGRISLINNPNELIVDDLYTTSKLPYFGEIQQSSGYNGSDNNIEFNGKTEDYQVIKNSNNTYTIKFRAKSKGESFNVTVTLYPNLKSDLFLKGNKRFSIRYSGFVKAYQDTTTDSELKS